MDKIIKNYSDKKDIIKESVSKELVYASFPELIEALGKNPLILEKSVVSVAASFENAVISPVDQSLKAEKAAIAFTLTPFAKQFS